MQADYRVDSIYVDEETGEIFAKCYDNAYDEKFEKYLGSPDSYDSRLNASTLLEDSSYSMTDELRNEIVSTFGLEDFGHEIIDVENYDNEIYAGNANGIVTEDELDAQYEVEESFSLREALNKIDLITDNKYDLRNLYEACNLSENEKKALATIIYDQDDPSVIYDTLNDRFVSGEEIGMPEKVKDGAIHEDVNGKTFSQWFDETYPQTHVVEDDDEFYPFTNYIKAFPNAEALKDATAEDIKNNAHKFYDIYPVDSDDREQAFNFASEELGIDYDILYRAWMHKEPITESLTEADEENKSPIVHKKSDGSYLVAADSGDGYTAFNKSDVCQGHISANSEQEAKNKFNANKFDESLNEDVNFEWTKELGDNIDDPDLYQTNYKGNRFNIWHDKEENLFHVTVDEIYEDEEEELQGYDEMGFTSLDDAKDYCQKVFNELHQFDKSLNEYVNETITSTIDGSELTIVEEDVIPNTHSFKATYTTGDSEGSTYIFVEADDKGVEYLETLGFKAEEENGDKFIDLPTEILEGKGFEGSFYITEKDFSEYGDLKEAIEEPDAEVAHNKVEVISWLQDHTQAWEDVTDFFGSVDLSEIDYDAILNWIADHEQLYSDFEKYFGLRDEDLTESKLRKDLMDLRKEENSFVNYKGEIVNTYGDYLKSNIVDKIFASDELDNGLEEQILDFCIEILGDGGYCNKTSWKETADEMANKLGFDNGMRAKLTQIVDLMFGKANGDLNESAQSWHDVYKIFLDIVDANYTGGNEAEIARDVEMLYRKHDGEAAWDEAWLRWLDHPLEPGDEGFEEADALYKSELDRIRNRKSVNESVDNMIYLFPELTDEDLEMVKAYGLTFLGKNHGPDGSENNWVVKGTEAALRRYADKYLGYELHPGYLYDEEDFAGDIINESVYADEPSSKEDIELDLKNATNNFTDRQGTVKCFFKEEADIGYAILNQHYETVTVEEKGEWFHLFYANLLDESKPIEEGSSLTHSPLSTAGPIPYAVKLLYTMDKFVMDVYDNEGWLMNGVPDGEFEETTADEAMQNYTEHAWLIEDADTGDFSVEDFQDFIDTFESVTDSRDYDQEERNRIIAEVDEFINGLNEPIDEDLEKDLKNRYTISDAHNNKSVLGNIEKLASSKLVKDIEPVVKHGIQIFEMISINNELFYLIPVTTSQFDIYDANENLVAKSELTRNIPDEILTDKSNLEFIYELIGGDYEGTYDDIENLPCFSGEYTEDQSDIRARGGFTSRPELDNKPILNGYVGPMMDGYKDHKMVLRYETQEVYDALSH